ncbi:TRAP transporter substrate-binding protein [Rhodobaculum claviforme]|uniref:C4-dicarboxylate ABC transporter substrate-binding protein n=1 Tax=Rhodobaculum claviforme TaxID=1549854 RepID=A0A934TNV6_9RHOB|nr:TRAP transporter substrate-binding protein [Rhodobaculum claviforme]MBK5928503.1 C4-dicarboxylate ABC transporter substrate-binding protein [Rhodobaculum claviforme]
MKHTAFPAAALLALCAGAPAIAQTEVKIAYALATESHYGAGALAWQEAVETATDGRFAFTHFPSSALGGEREVVEGIQIGTVEAALVSSGTLANFVPQAGVFDIPFLFRDLGHARAVLDGPIGQDMLARFDDVGLKALAWGEQGFRHITNNRGPIATPEDISGLRIRTMENPIHLRAFSTLGAAPTPMAWPEVIGALQQGTIDGQENPLSVIVSVGLSDVQEHLTLSGHVYSPAILLVSPQLWNGLSSEDQAAFVAGAEAGVAAMRGFVDDIESGGVETLRAQGMEVGELSAEQRAAFRDALVDAYAAYGTEFGAELIEAIIATE